MDSVALLIEGVGYIVRVHEVQTWLETIDCNDQSESGRGGLENSDMDSNNNMIDSDIEGEDFIADTIFEAEKGMPSDKIKDEQANNNTQAYSEHGSYPPGVQMNILSLNTQGVGKASKRRWIRRICYRHGITFLGFSGRIISTWDPAVFIKRNIFCGTNANAKSQVWDEVRHFKDSHPGKYIMFGDFNKVGVPEDRRSKWRSLKKEEENREFNHLQKEIEEIDIKIDSAQASPEDILQRINFIKQVNEIEKCRNVDLAKKSRVKWEVEWDENSKFFHGMLNQRRRQQNVMGIMQDGVWITDPVVVKEIFADFFEEKFKLINTFIPSALNPLFKQLSATNQALLEASVTHEEIKEAVWSCLGDKARALMAMEGLHVAVEEAMVYSRIRGVSVGSRNCTLSHLLYADDVIFVNEWSHSDISNITSLLREFYNQSGLKINMQKSNLFSIVVEWSDVQAMAELNGCIPGAWAKIVGVIRHMNDTLIIPWETLVRKNCMINERYVGGSLRKECRRQIRGGREQEQLQQLLDLLQNLQLSDDTDSFSWSLDSSGDFLVSSTRAHINVNTLSFGILATRWSNYISHKVNIFIWRLVLDKLPTRHNLSLRCLERVIDVSNLPSVSIKYISSFSWMRHGSRGLVKS
ncbi:hypothetical protein Tco_0732301 [Tanacetum coccineum]